MLNPQNQNININISYNLANQKVGKSIVGKKVTKNHKAHHQSSHNNCDIEIKLNKKALEHHTKKNNQHKIGVQTKKKKKKSQLQRSTFTPDIFAQRRIKTQGPIIDPEPISTCKKDIKHKHHKSVQANHTRSTNLPKKSNSQFKIPKPQKITHLASCTVPNWKKLPYESADHTISQGVQKKKRANSAFFRNDKIVTKILNASMLGSQLGGSQPITSERKINSSAQSKNLKQYMSSMDLRIIRTMQEDVPIFAKKQNSQEIIKNILASKKISLEELTRKVTVIQRKWRQKSKNSVINRYKLLFQQLADKLTKPEKISEISGIAHSISYCNSQEIFGNEGFNEFSEKLPFNSMQQGESQLQQSECRDVNLNIKKYRELVEEKVQKQDSKLKVKQKYKEQVQQWNNINKQITNVMNYKGSIDSQLLLDQLIQQSRNNQYWIDSEFDTNQLKKQRQSQYDIFEDEPHPKVSFSQSQPSQDITKRNQKENIEKQHNYDSLEEEQGYEYDKTKYEPVSNQINNDEEPQQTVPQTIQQPTDFTHQNSLQQVWVAQQVNQDNVVRNYLDCGLGDFGINIHSKIVQLPKNLKDDAIQMDSSLTSVDQAIGAKFEQANKISLQRKEDEPEEEPSYRRGIETMQIDQLVENTIRFLISEFATDISHILKKSTGVTGQKKGNQPRPQGISTSFQSLKEYLDQFISYIMRDQPNVNKIIETINKDIGPSSLEILTYLRPQQEENALPYNMDNEDPSLEDQDGLFVVPAQLFQQFELELEHQYRVKNQKQMGPRLKAYLSFWHRCIFQSYNECLDYQRPYGIDGKPYEWTNQSKKFHPIRKANIKNHLEKAKSRLLELTSLVGGIIFQKADSPFYGNDFSEQQRHMMNEERLSRILASELLESEQSWINYNDEMAELLVQLSRMLEEKLFFQVGTQLKKLIRRRKIFVEEAGYEEGVVFNIQQL